MVADEHSVEQVLRAVLASAKYRHVSPALVREIARTEIAKERGLKDTVKAVKNKLHQVAGAYLGEQPNLPYARWLAKIKEASNSQNSEELRGICRRIMGHHASTRERLPILDEFYSSIFAKLPPVHSIVDIACGLNPLSIPWMPLPQGVKYHAYDIYDDMMAFLGDFMAIAGVEGTAETQDVIAQPPTMHADLALVLKAIPCLEQIDKSGGRRLLDNLNATNLVLSFPVASLGGRKKGMAGNYEARFWEFAEDKDWAVKKLEFKTELVFVVRRNKMSIDPRAEYDRIAGELAAESSATISKMFGMPVLQKNGKAFAGFYSKNDAMNFKLAGPSHAEALALSGARLFDPSGLGRPMREWVEVPATHAANWPQLAREALRYVDDLAKKDS